jgi:hypothetical protein
MVKTQSAIGRLVSVPVREVWADEARDFTPWLSENLEDLSSAVGMDLVFEGTEVRVGPFSADLLLRDANTGGRIVVENMMGSTDHDHLGKIITYAAGLQATHAVLVAETFRPEHLSALQWLNTHSSESVGFFGIEFKVWRICDSKPAPQLDVVVKPDKWVREIRETNELTSLELAYRDFWSEFLPVFHQQHPGWSRAETPSKGSGMNFPAGKGGLVYWVSFCRPEHRYRFRIELYIDANNREEATRRFDELRDRRTEIETAFGETLEWEELDNSRGNRISSYFPEDVRVRNRERWSDLQAWAIDRMSAFKQALQPHIDSLP